MQHRTASRARHNERLSVRCARQRAKFDSRRSSAYRPRTTISPAHNVMNGTYLNVAQGVITLRGQVGRCMFIIIEVIPLLFKQRMKLVVSSGNVGTEAWIRTARRDRHPSRIRVGSVDTVCTNGKGTPKQNSEGKRTDSPSLN